MIPGLLPLADDAATTWPAAVTDRIAAGAGDRGLSIYWHVPFCATRCGYCDFNTYTPRELDEVPGTGPASYLAAALVELRRARELLGEVGPVRTVFVGGGTPTLLSSAQHAQLLATIQAEFGLAPGAEVTTEANPETLSPRYLTELREAGYTRLSMGMQSAVPHVLATLERRHTPGRALEAVRWARAAGFESISLDLIHGTPGESAQDWRTSVEAVIEADTDHASAYALIVEPGTRLAAQIRRGQMPPPDDDDQADKYLLAEELFAQAGYQAYELSNWAKEGHACRHNLAYWRGDHWWGIGPGAHSHVAGVRWWNVKHPRAYADRVAVGLPIEDHEVLSDEDTYVEKVMLELRLAAGLRIADLREEGQRQVPDQIDRGLLQMVEDRIVLTQRGRLLADAVIRSLLP
nr:radical SAM family heme chaperone HemW [Parenemella sanctibonifatiensis]